jgi:hypothetical protein
MPPAYQRGSPTLNENAGVWFVGDRSSAKYCPASCTNSGPRVVASTASGAQRTSRCQRCWDETPASACDSRLVAMSSGSFCPEASGLTSITTWRPCGSWALTRNDSGMICTFE